MHYTAMAAVRQPTGGNNSLLGWNCHFGHSDAGGASRSAPQCRNCKNQSEERFRSLVQNASNIIAVVAADGICYTSLSVKQILGYEPEDSLGKRLLNLSIPTIQAENLLTEAIHCSGTNSTAELRLQHADGSWRFLK